MTELEPQVFYTSQAHHFFLKCLFNSAAATASPAASERDQDPDCMGNEKKKHMLNIYSNQKQWQEEV